MGRDGLTLDAIKEIQADAHKAVIRQFRDEAEDNGWEPTPTPEIDESGVMVSDGHKPELSFKELQAAAKERGLSQSGTKAELQDRIYEYDSAQEGVE